MDIPDFTEADLARLALSVRLQELSESLRVAVAAEDGEVAGGLSSHLLSLLTSEVPRLREAIAGYARSRGEAPANLPDSTDQRGFEHVGDPAAAAAALDAWYVRHAQMEPLARVPDPFSRLLNTRSPRETACLICAKYTGEPVPAWAGYAVPPGGHLVDDGMWRVGHGPTPYWPAGTLLIESYRHFPDYSDLEPAEAASLGPLIQRFTGPLKEATGASRIHVFSCMEGTEHFHVWLVPRRDGQVPGRPFLSDPGYCGPVEAEETIDRLRQAMKNAGD